MTVAIKTKGPVVERFFHQFLRHTKGPHAGRPFVLEEWEREFLYDFCRVDPDTGRRLFRLGVLGVPRGNGKSPIAAGIGLYELVSRRDSPDVFCLAGAKEQAQILLDFAASFVETGPLDGDLEVNRRSIVYGANRGVMKVLAASGRLQHGHNPSAVIADELHAFTSEGQEETWNAMWTALHKRIDSFALGITTAGYDKETLLGRIYDEALELPDREDRRGGCLRIRRDYDNGVLFYWYGIPEDQADNWEDERLWRQANPASWVDIAELRKQLHAPGQDPYDFMRLHLNMWTLARSAWLPLGCWPGLAEHGATIPEGATVFAGVDVGWNHDSTAVGLCWRRPDGRYLIQAPKVWTTLPEQLGEYVAGGTMKLELVEDELRRVRRVYNLREVAYDPKYFGRSAQLLEREGFTMVELIPQGGPMRNAWQAFYQAAVEGHLVHDGDRVLTAHVDSAVAVRGPGGIKIDKHEGSKIDALSAVVMALDGCQLRGDEKPVEPNIFWMDI